jgi:hypothetical protein
VGAGLRWLEVPVRPIAILAALLSLVFVASAHAEQPVTNTNDSGPGSLRNALATALAGDIVEIPPGTYSLTSGQLVANDDNITLQGQLAGTDKPVIQSTGGFRVLCVNGAFDVTVEDLVIHGGTAAPGAGGACADSQGGGIHAEAGSILRVQNSWVQHNTASPAQGGGGGIFAAGDLFVSDTIVRHNTTTAGLAVGNNNGGGGIRWTGSGFPSFQITDSTVYENTATVGGNGSGGGGVYSANPPDLTNVTFSGNQHLAAAGVPTGGGGGGLFVQAGVPGSIVHATFFGNHSDRVGGALSGAQTTLANSLFHANTATTSPDCAAGSADSAQGNIESTSAPTCDLGMGDASGVDPQLGPLAVNGSNNGTLTHAILARSSPAVEFPANCPVAADQRGISRSQFGNCDTGAYEFDGNTIADVPACSPTGVIPLALDEPPGGDVDRLLYKVNGGAELQNDLTDVGEPPTPTSVVIPEGRNTLEYWGQWTNGIQQGHGFQDVLVDKTRPTVDVERPDGDSIFVITRRETVNVSAADALSGLVQDPSGTGVRVDTGRRGTATYAPTATDLCENQASDAFDYRVLAPGLGVRTVLERVRGRVRVRRRASGAAHASQKGTPFTALTQPRELPVASFIDAKRGTTRLTSARTRREDQIQDGLFSAGVFQVLQSRRVRARGLTNLKLRGGNFKRCARAGKGARAAGISRRAIRRLRGNARGRFRTTGRNSSATVRGTIWEVIDRCDGTLTRVKRGRVVVRDFRRKKTVIVRAGKSYLARSAPSN